MFYIYLYPAIKGELVNPNLFREAHEYELVLDSLDGYIPENTFSIAIESETPPSEGIVYSDDELWYYEGDGKWFQCRHFLGIAWKNEASTL